MDVLTHLGGESLENRHVLFMGIQASQPFREFVFVESDFERLLTVIKGFLLGRKIEKSCFRGANAAGFANEDEAFGKTSAVLGSE